MRDRQRETDRLIELGTEKEVEVQFYQILMKIRPIALSCVLLANRDDPTDQTTDQPSKRLIESRTFNKKSQCYIRMPRVKA